MTSQEKKQLQDFLAQLAWFRDLQRDPEGDQLIRSALDDQPDATCLLVQRSLLMEKTLTAASSRITELERQLRSLQLGAAMAAASATGALATH
jgi:hypothetical protein